MASGAIASAAGSGLSASASSMRRAIVSMVLA
jgi:hypothetical protein